MLDLHGWCPKGDSPVILLTIYYTPEWHSPPQDGTASAKNEDHHQIEPAAPKTDNQ
jgi:hypothetical protein